MLDLGFSHRIVAATPLGSPDASFFVYTNKSIMIPTLLRALFNKVSPVAIAKIPGSKKFSVREFVVSTAVLSSVLSLMTVVQISLVSGHFFNASLH
jgi:hypothetical protein